jgi:HAE1 family hydrophobic/amphiphilic exporter-1
MGLTRLALTRPVAILMLFGALIVLGLNAYTRLPVDRLPRQTFPVVQIAVSYPGASPQDVVEFIIKPIERAVFGAPGLDSLDATASQGQGVVIARFAEGVNLDAAAADIERRVSRIRGQLPADAGAPSIIRTDVGQFPILNVIMTGRLSATQLYELASDVVVPALQSTPGVADVTLSGGRAREIQVRVDPLKLKAYELSLQQVANAITQENVDIPAGTVTVSDRENSVRLTGQFRSVEEIQNLVIPATGAAAAGSGPRPPVRIKDVATVEDTLADVTRIQRYNGQEGIGITVVKQSDANSIKVADAVKSALARNGRITRQLPQGVEFIITNDTTTSTRHALAAVQNDLVLAVLICGAVLLLFLHSWRNTLIVLLAIPTSLISTFLVMFFAGFTLNLMSLMALALLIGILVDDSIVVLENIHRHLGLGETPFSAALKGRSEIGLAAMAITFMDVVVYVPVAFMAGNLGTLFREFGLTIAAATLFSLFVSFTLTPMLASRWMKPHDPHHQRRGWNFGVWWDRNFTRLSDGYGRVLEWCLRHRPLPFLIGIVALAACWAMVQYNVIGTEYAPQEDTGQFNVNLTMPPGTGLAVTDAAVRRIEQQLLAMPEVKTVFTSVGGQRGRFASLSVELVPKDHRTKTVWQIMQEVRDLAAENPELTVRTSIPSGFGGFGGGINVRLSGPDADTLARLGEQVEAVVRRTPGAVEVVNSSQAGEPEVRAVVNHEALADLGLTTNQVAQAIRTAVQGTVASQLRVEGQTQVDIRVMVERGADRQLDLQDLEAIPILSSRGFLVRLGQVAKVSYASGPAQINRTNRQPVMSISASVSGRPLGDVARDLRAALRSVQVPAGYSVSVVGQAQQLDRAFQSLVQALALSVILMYMLMAALYESFLHPLTVLLSLPLALVGALIGLKLTNNTLNIFSMIGMIMLMGLVAKNAILLVDFTNTLRQRGLSRFEALRQAGPIRLRPILMTTSTMVFSMIPLALKLGEGSETRSPMAIVVIGGLVSSTLLTLLFVPVLYTYLDDFQGLLVRTLRWRPSWRLRLRRRPMPAPEPVPAPVPASVTQHSQVPGLGIQPVSEA